jgi:hypothetical protein
VKKRIGGISPKTQVLFHPELVKGKMALDSGPGQQKRPT